MNDATPAATPAQPTTAAPAQPTTATPAQPAGKARPGLRFLLSHPAHFISLGFGAGLAPFAPGTFGTLLGLILARWLHPILGDEAFFSTLIIALVASVWAAGVSGRALGASDHSAIVSDEILAMAFITAMLPGALGQQAWAFLLFRLLDIKKPGPIGWADRTVKGPVGVMLDDLLAALLTLFAIALWLRVFS